MSLVSAMVVHLETLKCFTYDAHVIVPAQNTVRITIEYTKSNGEHVLSGQVLVIEPQPVHHGAKLLRQELQSGLVCNGLGALEVEMID